MTHRPRILVHDVPLSGVIRSLAYHGHTKEQILGVLAAEGIDDPNRNTINTQMYHGRKHAEGVASGGPILDLPQSLLKKVGKPAKDTPKKKTAAKRKNPPGSVLAKGSIVKAPSGTKYRVTKVVSDTEIMGKQLTKDGSDSKAPPRKLKTFKLVS